MPVVPNKAETGSHSMNSMLVKLIFRPCLFVLFMLAGLANGVHAEEISISARVDKNQLSLEDSVQLSITVHGVQNAPEPQLPELANFTIRSRGTSSSTQIINGQVNISVTKTYLLVPQKSGTFTLGPATLELAGVTYRTDPITLTVSAPSQNTRKKSSPAFVETSISNKNPFVNEQLIYTFRLYRRVEARNFNLSMSYEDKDFRKEDLGDAKVVSRVINGVQYKVHELSVALFPIHAGNVEIPPATLELDLINRSRNSRRRNPFPGLLDDSFFGARGSSLHKILRSPPLQVNVRPLPEKGKPKNFSNLVGKVTLSATLGKNELEVGDTTTLTVTVKGPGPVKELSLDLPEMDETFKIYPDQPEIRTFSKGKDLIGEKVFKFALVPLKSGKANLPSIFLPYFDPVTEQYQTATTRPVELTVLPSADNENLKITESTRFNEKETGNNIKVLAEDILPIHTRLADFEKDSRPNMMLYTAGLVIPPFLFLLFTAYVRYSLRLKYDTAFVRNRRAYKIASQKLKRLSSAKAEVNSPREFAKSLSEIFREYIGNKLNLQGKAITSMEVERKLMERHFPEKQALSTRKLLEKYESLQYAPNNFGKNDDLIEESLELLNQLEKQP
jgi:oxygen tolerance protein BatD